MKRILKMVSSCTTMCSLNALDYTLKICQDGKVHVMCILLQLKYFKIYIYKNNNNKNFKLPGFAKSATMCFIFSSKHLILYFAQRVIP
jgi:hypothetical protein